MKKIYYSIIALCLSFGVFGQELRVSSTGNVVVKNSSYLYVNNVTVDAGGNLTIQSDATNSASLLVNGTATGDINYERYLATTNWYLLSAPVTTQDVDDFVTANTAVLATSGTVATRRAVGYFDTDGTAGSRWIYYDSASNPAQLQGNFNSGEGYTMNRTAAGTLSFTGNVATADVMVPMTSTNGSYLWHSVGNPFPSFLPGNTNANATSVLGENLSKLDPSFAFLYIWNGSAYVPIGQADAAFHIAPGQAFMVHPIDDNEDFLFSENLTNHQSEATTFYRNSNPIASLKVRMNDGTDEKSTEIRYLDNVTTGLDPGYDAGAFQEGTPTFAIETHLVSDSNGIDFTLQCLPENNYENMVVPLSVYATSGETLDFSISTENLPSGVNVFIEDKALNTNLLLDGSNTYQVTLNSNESGIGRFYIHTTASAVLSTDDVTLSSTLSIFKSDASTLTLTGINSGVKTTMALYSVLGKQVFAHSFTASTRNDIALPKSLSAGIYITRVQVENGGTVTKKIIID
jgi:hypothetical protein